MSLTDDQRVRVGDNGHDPLLDLADDPAIAFLAEIESEKKHAEAYYATHPFAFLTDCVQTIDQATGMVRRFPSHVDHPHAKGTCSACYLEAMTDLWVEERLLLVVKSRRMLMTWLFVALHVWYACFRPLTKVAFCARKQGLNESEGSAELVWRARFIAEHLPLSVRPVIDYKFLRLSFPQYGSEIIGVGEGPDQLRQQTLSAIFADEFGFWERPYDTYIAARPTIEGGGRFTGVSTPAPGFFKQLVMDQV